MGYIRLMTHLLAFDPNFLGRPSSLEVQVDYFWNGFSVKDVCFSKGLFHQQFQGAIILNGQGITRELPGLTPCFSTEIL